MRLPLPLPLLHGGADGQVPWGMGWVELVTLAAGLVVLAGAVAAWVVGARAQRR